MKVTIRLRYRTRFGQELFLCGGHELLGRGRREHVLPMRYVNEELWEVVLDLTDRRQPARPLSYYFRLRNPDGSLVEDFGSDRRIHLSTLSRGHTLILESWNDPGTVENVFFTEPFQNILLPAETGRPVVNRKVNATHSFKVKAPLLPPEQTICLLGSAPGLRAWDESAPVLLRRDSGHGCFAGEIDLAQEAFPIAYKYGVYDIERKRFIRYEAGDNRMLEEPRQTVDQVIVNDGFARLTTPPWRGAGVAIPVFSLRSEKSFGVGEFGDLPLLADWAGRVGLKLIQILPVNDTGATNTWMDSYPYAAISAFALHPLYLNLDRLAGAGDRRLLKSIARRREALNALETVDYEAVMAAKLAFLRQIFSARRETAFASATYRKFFAQNKHWLVPYAAFCVLRDRFGTTDFTQWPEHREYDAQRIRALIANDSAAAEAAAFQYFIQFHLHSQLREAAESLRRRRIILKGDIAIGVHPHSADVWQQPELFHTDMQAGAPPDAFATKGQNWGFPTYNWTRMQRDGFDWWKRRFAQMSRYFDAFRIDHILGFFRIWSIPQDAVEGILGRFTPAIPVRESEFAGRGIQFNRERLTRPFINETTLRRIFGDGAAAAVEEFLILRPDGTYCLRPELSTQRDVARHFASRETDAHVKSLRDGLFDLITNVLLLEVRGDTGTELHFRLGMDQTDSFGQLDTETRKRLKELYVDYFFRRQDEFWRRDAMQKLPALKRVTNMLICGEDLGMVPAVVPEVMKELGLLSLGIQRMPKTLNADFAPPAEASYLSVVTPATHDMSTIRGWWEEDRRLVEKFFHLELRQSGPAPVECEPWINREIVRQHLESPAMWSIFQLQDLLGMDKELRRAQADPERINVPAIPRYYWRYRMHLTLEELGGADGFNGLLAQLIRTNGRRR